ncbi:enoyl-CoA hydratase-related protein [Nocardia yamanashiensis]|uniref:enoyl-CoA hydratase/isomerase family protein n=1 Tax=Nocardia yamanashiensis TaxID=209247 RepID=UPI001E316724|nr:enoyl-CoA hydratase-related protein [Nocardia yamanashiensis]UGT45519.1 enoyl-CoA hydratase-related protein [Nocardia yamanashiensis]
MTMRFRTLRLEVGDGVAVVTLNRPERRNAFTGEMGAELAAAYGYCDGADEVRVVVLTGEPPAFCAGADLGAGDRTFSEPGAKFSAAGIGLPAWRIRKPVIAAVNGHALGIGLTMALQADICLMAQDAKYGVLQVRRGMIGDAYSHWVLPRLVGVSRAAYLLLTGATFDGRRARDMGLCLEALPNDEVLGAAMELARDIAVNAAPLAVAASKRLLWESFESDAGRVGQLETDLHLMLMGHEDAKEGVRAFQERRAPKWAGSASELPDGDGIVSSTAHFKHHSAPGAEPTPDH